MPYTIKIKCICCEGLESFGSCPLCENNRYFDYEIDQEIDEYMHDFYEETMIDSGFAKLNDEQKKSVLDLEISNYFDP